MKIYRIIVMSFCSFSLIGMDQKSGTQHEICGAIRRAYVVSNIINKPTEPKCPFCDKEILSSNYIVCEDHEKNLRIMLNKNPYIQFEQGRHILFMPISHGSSPENISQEQIIQQTDAVQEMIAKLHDDTYTQEFFYNWSRMAGASVPDHLHGHLKSYTDYPRSLPEQVKANKQYSITNIEDAYKALMKKLESKKNISIASEPIFHDKTKCDCCKIKDNEANDKDNFVIGRFDHNYVCLSHYPSTPGELSVVPNRHVSSIKDLSQEELRENMTLAMALLAFVKPYANENIRKCDGGNIFIDSIGGKTSDQEKSKRHVHTLVMPRVDIPATPGTLVGTSNKLDVNPDHLAEYLRSKIGELKEKTANIKNFKK